MNRYPNFILKKAPFLNFLALFALFTASSLLFAQEQIDFTGFGAAGFRVYDRNQLRKYNQVSYYEGKFQADITINKHIEAQIDMRGNSDDNQVKLHEFSAKFEYMKLMRFKVGNIKKPFGSEELLEREDLASVDRSHIQQTISDLGYGGRGVSVMAYYNYNKKRSEFPFSYAVSFFKDNSLNSGIVTRGVYHFDDYALALNYMYLHKGNETPLNASGFCTNLDFEHEGLKYGIALFYVRDPNESLRRQAMLQNDHVYSTGMNISSSFNFNTGGDVIKSIEPLLVLGVFAPDSKATKYNTIEALPGINFYFQKKVRFRINGDLLLTKNLYNSSYTTVGSQIVTELQVCF